MHNFADQVRRGQTLLGKHASPAHASFLRCFSVSNLYLSGACLNSNCTLTAGPLTCPGTMLMSPLVSTCLPQCLCVAVRASDYYNLSSLVRTDDLTYQFASDIVCRPASNTSYFYTSTTCAQFDPSWIQVREGPGCLPKAKSSHLRETECCASPPTI